MTPNGCRHLDYAQCREAGCFEGLDPEPFRRALAARHDLAANYPKRPRWAPAFEKAVGGLLISDTNTFPRAMLHRILDAVYAQGRADEKAGKG